MLKRLKSVSMLLFLMGASTGAAYAVANPGVTDVKITQQSGTCTGIVKDATGETVIGASVVVKGTTNGTITGLDGDFSYYPHCCCGNHRPLVRSSSPHGDFIAGGVFLWRCGIAEGRGDFP